MHLPTTIIIVFRGRKTLPVCGLYYYFMKDEHSMISLCGKCLMITFGNRSFCPFITVSSKPVFGSRRSSQGRVSMGFTITLL